MKSFAVHYKNVYPGGRVDFTEDRLDAYDADGIHRVALRRGGNGQIIDTSAEVGAFDSHDLAPIPKNARVHKLYADGKIGYSEEYKERWENAKQLRVGGKVLSIKAYESNGVLFDAAGNAEIRKPAPVESDKE